MIIVEKYNPDLIITAVRYYQIIICMYTLKIQVN